METMLQCRTCFCKPPGLHLQSSWGQGKGGALHAASEELGSLRAGPRKSWLAEDVGVCLGLGEFKGHRGGMGTPAAAIPGTSRGL